jgi:hypothetical protein
LESRLGQDAITNKSGHEPPMSCGQMQFYRKFEELIIDLMEDRHLIFVKIDLSNSEQSIER